jgi:hypothetical protein
MLYRIEGGWLGRDCKVRGAHHQKNVSQILLWIQNHDWANDGAAM